MRKAKPGNPGIDLAVPNPLNAEGCPACGRRFDLGDPVVEACGAWEGGPRLIHEHEAVFATDTAAYAEKRCNATQAGRIGCSTSGWLGEKQKRRPHQHAPFRPCRPTRDPCGH